MFEACSIHCASDNSTVSDLNRKSLMLPFQIKICGVKRISDARSVAQSGADAIGFNFYPPSDRCIDLETASELSRYIDDANQQLETAIKKVGVFVNMSAEKIVSAVRQCRLDGIQLHGEEPISLIAELKTRLVDVVQPCFIARAIRTNPKSSLSDAEQTRLDIDNWTDAGADLLLLDAAVPGEFGGTGHVLDWNSVANLKLEVPLTLAGGLNPANVAEAISVSQVKSVDVASGVESAPGIKDHDKIMRFVAAAKGTLN